MDIDGNVFYFVVKTNGDIVLKVTEDEAQQVVDVGLDGAVTLENVLLDGHGLSKGNVAALGGLHVRAWTLIPSATSPRALRSPSPPWMTPSDLTLYTVPVPSSRVSAVTVSGIPVTL